MVNRRANNVVFGFDFQVNAAIVLMLKDIKKLSSLKLEGNYEDIELCFNDGEYILVQAKGINEPISDTRNVRKNLKKALETLSEGEKAVKTKKLIFITNSRNPLNENITNSVFEGESYREYSTLSSSSKEIIDQCLSNIEEPLDTKKLMIQILPFETDNEDERYKIVKTKIDEFLVDLNLSIRGIGKKVMSIWQNNVFENATKKNADIKLTKAQIVWPLICIITDMEKNGDDILRIMDESIYEEVVYRYHDLIDMYTEKFSFITKVIYDYSDFKSNRIRSERFLDFIEKSWELYKEDFALADDDVELEKVLIQVILYTILKNRLTIKKIKEGVGL